MPVQKRYKVKNMTTGEMEEVYAFNDQEVIESYKIVGHEVKIIGTVELPGAIGAVDDPDPLDAQQQQFGLPPASTGMPMPPVQPPRPGGPPQEFQFSANGLDFKLTPDGVYMKTWVDLEDADYRILSQKTGRETNDYRVQVKDWVKTENPNDKAPEQPQEEVKQEPAGKSPEEAGETLIG